MAVAKILTLKRLLVCVCMYVCVSGHTCHVHVEIRGQQCGVTSLLLPLCGLCEDQSQSTGIPCKRFTPKASCRPLPPHILNALRFSKQCCVLQFILTPSRVILLWLMDLGWVSPLRPWQWTGGDSVPPYPSADVRAPVSAALSPVLCCRHTALGGVCSGSPSSRPLGISIPSLASHKGR